MPAHSFPLWPAPFCNGEADDLTFPEGLLLRLVPLGLETEVSGFLDVLDWAHVHVPFLVHSPFALRCTVVFESCRHLLLIMTLLKC